MKPRFKIDFYDMVSCPFGLYHRKGRLLSSYWRLVTVFQTKEDALAYYASIKDLPEYLD